MCVCVCVHVYMYLYIYITGIYTPFCRGVAGMVWACLEVEHDIAVAHDIVAARVSNACQELYVIYIYTYVCTDR